MALEDLKKLLLIGEITRTNKSNKKNKQEPQVTGNKKKGKKKK
jgi:hypothetical protein